MRDIIREAVTGETEESLLVAIGTINSKPITLLLTKEIDGSGYWTRTAVTGKSRVSKFFLTSLFARLYFNKLVKKYNLKVEK